VRGLGKPSRVAVALLSVAAVAAIVVLSRSVATRAPRVNHDSPAPVTTLAAAKAAGGRRLTLGPGTVGPAIAPGFDGLTIRFRALEQYAGTDPNAPDPAFIQLLRDIAPNQSRVLRIGGDSTDWTWWPIAHVRKPAGVRFNLTPAWMSMAKVLASAAGARLILGVNLEANNRRLAVVEAKTMLARIGRPAIDAFEIGNEPELYGTFGYYRSASGKPVPGRPHSYDETDFVRQFSSFARSMPSGPIAGPDSGSPVWLSELGAFLRDEPRVGLATVHAYPLKHCGNTPVTIGELLADSSSHGLAQLIAPFVRAADVHHVALRVDEMNAVSCGGQRGVSDSFASALWVLDALFELAKTGVRGVNIQTVPNTINEVLGADLVHGTWRVRVHPEYYGMIMFAQAAPAGSRVLRLSGKPQVGVKVWATRGPDPHVRVVVINKHLRHGEVVRLRIPSAQGPASIEQLRAPSMRAKSGVTLGGQSFGAATTTGLLGGKAIIRILNPSAGAYAIRVPGASATMLTVPVR
jgi:hypothetical protein